MFRNRQDAGEQLGSALLEYKGKDVVVLGVARGGIETAYFVAKRLNADLSAVVARKLGYPSNPEAAFGAIAEDGTIYLSPDAGSMLTLSEIEAVVELEKQVIERRIKSLRGSLPFPDIAGKTVLIVDDGIATGATTYAIIDMCRKKKAGKVVVATPVCGESTRLQMAAKADRIVVLETPSYYQAVSQVYADFQNLPDEEARAFLSESRKESPAMRS